MRKASPPPPHLLTATGLAGLALLALLAGCQITGPEHQPPNVILIMTDDQGYGDFGYQGNPILRTPHLDAMARRGARLDNFYVHGVCTPTRAALMTGRHPQRTRAFDTFVGRAMMSPGETTIAEVMLDAGYATGIFGKWHLGDCFPMRAMDQGFEEALVHLGGGIGQPSDPPGGEGKYSDPILHHNGEPVATKGYCTDVYFDAAIDWMQQQSTRGKPFFTYLATNAPHGPFRDVPAELYDYYRQLDLSHARFPQEVGAKLAGKPNTDRLARIFAMIENIDQNIGKLFESLDRIGISENTLVLFLIDNGPNTRRYVAGFRGQKNRVHEGGVRSPLVAHWPGHLAPGLASDRICAHYDLMPTILEACGIAAPDRLDGRSLWPLLQRRATAWPDRALVIQHHRGDLPVRFHNCLVRTQRYKLVNPSGFHRELTEVTPAFELFDMVADPYELHDLAAAQPETVQRLRRHYEQWFDDIMQTPDIGTPPAIHLGDHRARRVVLSRQDIRRRHRDGKSRMAYWLVDVITPGPYQLTVRHRGKSRPSRVRVKLGKSSWEQPWGTDKIKTLESLALPSGRHQLQVDLSSGGRWTAAYQVTVRKH